MIEKFKNFCKNLLGNAFYGLKVADSEILSQKGSSNVDDISVHQMVTDQRVAPHLLQGEVTQEVEELRYRDYKVYNTSKQYKYIGEGNAEQHQNDNWAMKFVQPNINWCGSVADGMKWQETQEKVISPFFTIIYEVIPKFKIEVLCDTLQVDLKMSSITFNLNGGNTIGEINWRRFVKWFHNPINHKAWAKLFLLEFTTYKCDNEDDFVLYVFNDLTLTDKQINGGNIQITYQFNNYQRNSVLDKFKSKELEEKYKNKEAKKSRMHFYDNNEQIYFCSLCNKMMDKIDYNITKETYGYPICQNCLNKTLELNNLV